MRSYEKSHPFIDFKPRTESAPAKLWLLLGEAKSKCDHIGRVPLHPRVHRELQRIYLAKGVLGTTAIEGNTLSEEEVMQHLDGKLELPPSKGYLKREIDNIVRGCNEILSDTTSGWELTVDRIKAFNATVLDGLELDAGIVPGQVRQYSVGVGNYRAAPAEDCEYLLERLCAWVNSKDFQPPPGEERVYALIKAILVHLYLAWIHAFGDGNGRTARLAEYFILVQAGVPSAAAHLLSNHYSATRSEYYRKLSQASRTADGVTGFLTYAVQGFVDGIREQLERVIHEQMTFAWLQFVSDELEDDKPALRQRRVNLVRAIADREWTRADLHKAVAWNYLQKTTKTLTRDLNHLVRLNLVDWSRGRIRGKRELMLGFVSKAKSLPNAGQEKNS